ncbi:SLC13 family permease [Acaryochloris sp. CCMEE 5410]|uniref:SLC13 family permease n=1 Tax=Acaryochloris sp. CCMEE 5410 TaxID=310037 RepID=UPI0002483F70|nr:SLC13 family permease [Acaryochloris sp. CCMEE 5410]KAI9134416.1 SLC13 family permease [Acaryochloris sp. CCMEE 5410]
MEILQDPKFLTLGVLTLALIAFVAEWLPVDITALMVTAALILLGLVSPDEGISGFGNSATITVLLMFILSAGIARTGIIQMMRDWLIRWGGRHPSQQIVVMGLLVGPITAFINNTAVVAVFLPIIEDWCRKQNISPSKLLIPLSYVTIMGGMITVVGTSTNILASGVSKDLGYGEFSLFQFTGMGLVTFVVGLVFLAVAAPRLLPKRKAATLSLDDFDLKDYVSEITIPNGSSLVGQTLRTTGLQRKFDLDVLELIRGAERFSQPLADLPLQVDDLLLVRGSRTELLSLRDQRDVEIMPAAKFSGAELEADLSTGAEMITEVLVLSNARLIGSTLKDLKFRQRYNVTVLAIRRGEALVRDRLGQVRLQFGDLLLVQGPRNSLAGLQSTRELLVMEPRDIETLRPEKAWVAIAIILGVIGAAALDLAPILVTALVGVLLMILTGCLKPGELYGAVRWDVIFLLAGLLPLGIAMDKSGATEWLAQPVVAVGQHLSGYGVLVALYIFTSLLTEIISNNAAVVLVIPLAVQVATTLSLNPLAFIFAITFAASNSYMTPIGYQTNTMVYGPGGYKFLDFMRIGLPLNILMAIVTPLLIVQFYGL